MATEKEAPKEAAPAAAASNGGGAGWLPVIVILVLVPAISFAMAEFVLFPRLEARLAAAAGGGHGETVGTQGGTSHGNSSQGGSSHGGSSGHGSANAEPTFSYEFKDVICNLAGSMKSRYIKVGFTAYSSNPEFEEIAVHNRAKLLDATLSVLGSLTIADLEETTATVKNKVRSQLLQAYENLLHERVVEEIYFSDWVIQ